MNISDTVAMLKEAQMRNPMLLIAVEFDAGQAVIQVYNALQNETDPGGERLLSHEDIMNRIDDVLAVMYAGIV